MEEKLNKLKTSLDKDRYKNISFNDEMQDVTIEKLRSIKSENKRSYKPMLASLVAITVALLLFFSFDFSSVHRNSANIGNEAEPKDYEDQSVNYLVVLSREDKPSILLININKEEKEAKYISVPNKLYINNVLFDNPITEDAIEKAFSVKITNTFLLDDNILGDFIEKNKGIQVNNDFDFEYGQSVFKEGIITFQKGQELVDFTSMRVLDPRGDHGRDARVISVLEELFKQEEFYTDILKKKMTEFDKVLLSIKNIKFEDNVVFEEQNIDGVYSEKIDDKNLEKLKKSFGWSEN
ncbi:LCP family protein [Metabacillus endolithicus]|uniref:LCP family protein n=1 Tax=Metabacillus endolithicus TaxID=1535204 RepID=A0ABW5C691_9BACI|nr:LCP family protein [Metabacillus endolithicus]UPG66067.1 LCP family protein [Metabacillus endolithicus]